MKLLAFLVVLLVPAAAMADVAEDVKRLVARLGDDRYEERERAQQELAALGVEAKEAMQAELAATTDAEVRIRLKAILEEMGRVQWLTDLKVGLLEAERLGKPLLVIGADGTMDKPGTRETSALLAAVRDETLQETLATKFVLVWSRSAAWGDRAMELPASSMPPEGTVEPPGEVFVFFCTSRGRVRHALSGWWSAQTLREEIPRALKLLAASDASQSLKERSLILKSLQEDVATLRREKAEELRKPDSEASRNLQRLDSLVRAWSSEEMVGEPVETWLRVHDIERRNSGLNRDK